MAIVTNETEFRARLNAGDPDIIISRDISLTTYTTINYDVRISSEPEANLFWGSPRASAKYMFVVTSSGTLTLENITLDSEGRDGGLVRLNGGTLIMNDGTTMKGIVTNTSSHAVLIGELGQEFGGHFIMNGGLITELDVGPSNCVFCCGGTIEMTGTAAIDNNKGNGLGIISTMGGQRSTVIISGNAAITNNTSGQTGGGILSLESDIIIGVNDGDHPIINGNHSPYHCGGIYLSSNSTAIIDKDSEVSENTCALHAGGIILQTNSTLTIKGNAVVWGNRSGANCGGIAITSSASLILDENAQIYDNMAADETLGAGVGGGGGFLMQSRGLLEMKGNSSIHGNNATSGGGIYLSSSAVAIIGSENSSPRIYGNKAENLGGGIFIYESAEVTAAGNSSINENTAVYGNGVYNMGRFKVAENAKILDGLYFDEYTTTFISDLDVFSEYGNTANQSEDTADKNTVNALLHDLEVLDIPTKKSIFQNFGAKSKENKFSTFENADALAAVAPLDCNWAPIIDAPLGENAEIHIESSPHVDPKNVPLVIANGDVDAIPLTSLDRLAWRIPDAFAVGYKVELTPDLEKVIIDNMDFNIRYENLCGTEHSNPLIYNAGDLPIPLTPPTVRAGFKFLGWENSQGEIVTEISVDSLGDLTFYAVWEETILSFNGNGEDVCCLPAPIPAGGGSLIIPGRRPCRPCFQFLAWNIPDSGDGKLYFPGDTIFIADNDITLFAQWILSGCEDNNKCCRPFDANITNVSPMDNFPDY